MKNRRKSQIKSLIVFTLVLSLMSIGSIGYILAKSYFQKDNSAQVIQGTTSNSFYSLRSNATAYQKEVYGTLSDELNKEIGDDKLIAELVASGFIIDYYTWSNKLTASDVGGLQYIDSSIRSLVYYQSMNEFYANMQTYLNDKTIKDTLAVDSVSATSEEADITVNDEVRSGFIVTVSWTYQKSAIVDTDNYEQASTVYILKDDTGRFNIVRVEGSESVNEDE